MNLQKFGVQELSVQEQKETQGGWWFQITNIFGPGPSHGYVFGYMIW
jgi:hypothetical protein